MWSHWYSMSKAPGVHQHSYQDNILGAQSFSPSSLAKGLSVRQAFLYNVQVLDITDLLS